MVVGDLMLDHYVWGCVNRISPEAPVPVVDVESETYRFGGAANVSYNVMSLGTNVIPVGIIGDDLQGEILKEIFDEKGISSEGLVIDKERPTTVKTRIIADSQHVVRTDREIRHGIHNNTQQKILDFIEHHLENIDSLILEDYNKGLLVPNLIHAIIKMAQSHQIKILVDPKFDQFFEYKGVTLFKPNRKEVADKLGVRLESEDALQRAGEELLSRLQCEALLITLGGEGMALFEQGEPFRKVPTQAIKVHDVSGAGDTVIATIAVALAAGANFKEAATIANHAAGIVCGEVGIIPIDHNRLLEVLMDEIDKSQ
jgi:D-beta-D-heptose 7-phosphate kinase/D-beta-D-heptose 1-phosphate adenosyltransferase